MHRRRHTWTIFAIVIVQLLASLAFAVPCVDSCEGEQDDDCPPACALCTTCMHAQQAIVQHAGAGEPRRGAAHLLPPAAASASPSPASEIFHVPLAS